MSLFVDFSFYYKDRAHWHRVIDSKAGEMVKQEMARKGMQFLYWMDFGRIDFASKMPLKTLEEFQREEDQGTGRNAGLRAYGPWVRLPLFSEAGGLLALQRNTIDGAISGSTSFWERKYLRGRQVSYGCRIPVRRLRCPYEQEDMGWVAQGRADHHAGSGQGSTGVGTQRSGKDGPEGLELLKKKGMQYYYVPGKRAGAVESGNQ